MRALARAVRNVRRARRELRKIDRCPAELLIHHERPYAVRCDLIAGHAGEHRHRPLGQTEVVTWWT